MHTICPIKTVEENFALILLPLAILKPKMKQCPILEKALYGKTKGSQNNKKLYQMGQWQDK